MVLSCKCSKETREGAYTCVKQPLTSLAILGSQSRSLGGNGHEPSVHASRMHRRHSLTSGSTRALPERMTGRFSAKISRFLLWRNKSFTPPYLEPQVAGSKHTSSVMRLSAIESGDDTDTSVMGNGETVMRHVLTYYFSFSVASEFEHPQYEIRG